MTRGVAGIYIKKHLYDFHLADIIRVAEAGKKDHETQGCGYAKDWDQQLAAHLLKVLPGIIGDFMEQPHIEVCCPKRDAEVKEAA